MATNFPNSLDSFTNPVGSNNLSSPSHADQHANVNDAVEAIETHLLDGYLYRQTVYFTSSGTFTKATYPWLRAIRVKVQGAGGGGGGSAATGAGQAAVGGSGGGGAYAESFITNIAGLSASETVTVGAGGAGGAAGANAGSAGGASSFGALVSANGGNPGGSGVAISPPARNGSEGAGGTTATGDLIIAGGRAARGIAEATNVVSRPDAGTSFLGGRVSGVSTTGGDSGESAGANQYGAGATGGFGKENRVAEAGGTGGAGIVIVELYA
jgi:hypothetical protein